MSELYRKFGKTGPWIYNGEQLDSMQLTYWLAWYNEQFGKRVKLSQIREKHIRMFLAQRELHRNDHKTSD